MKIQTIGSIRKTLISLALFLPIAATVACQNYSEKITGSKSAANETAAIGALRTIRSSQTLYWTAHNGEYATFDQLVTAGNLDARFRGEKPVIGGYVLTLRVTAPDSGGRPGSYTVSANPQQTVAPGSTGTRHFFTDSNDDAIRVNQNQTASATDPAL